MDAHFIPSGTFLVLWKFQNPEIQANAFYFYVLLCAYRLIGNRYVRFNVFVCLSAPHRGCFISHNPFGRATRCLKRLKNAGRRQRWGPRTPTKRLTSARGGGAPVGCFIGSLYPSIWPRYSLRPYGSRARRRPPPAGSHPLDVLLASLYLDSGRSQRRLLAGLRGAGLRPAHFCGVDAQRLLLTASTPNARAANRKQALKPSPAGISSRFAHAKSSEIPLYAGGRRCRSALEPGSLYPQEETALGPGRPRVPAAGKRQPLTPKPTKSPTDQRVPLRPSPTPHHKFTLSFESASKFRQVQESRRVPLLRKEIGKPVGNSNKKVPVSTTGQV